MTDTTEDTLRTRLGRLPGQFALALVNATAILVIVAAILALAAFVRVEQAAGNVAATMTDAVMARVDVDPEQLVANLQDVTEDLRSLKVALAEARENGTLLPETQAEQLQARLDALQTGIRQLTETRTQLFDEALAGIGNAIATGLQALRNCTPTLASAAQAKEPPASSSSDL